jgi:hypothetical protein
MLSEEGHFLIEQSPQELHRRFGIVAVKKNTPQFEAG